MKFNPRQLALAAAAAALTASFSMPSQAQDSRSEDMIKFFKMARIDSDKDGMVSRKEFLEAMGKSWDMHMTEARKADPKMKDKMTLDQFKSFSKMFGLDIGS